MLVCFVLVFKTKILQHTHTLKLFKYGSKIHVRRPETKNPHHSTLQIHCENEPETRLDWSTIYDKLINQNRGGLCYERDETLYQVLNFIGYEVYRIEVSGIVGAKAVEPRHDHMAIGVKLNNAWYLCDIGWGGFMYEGALAITAEPTLTRRFTARCVESAYHTPEKSDLAPGMTRWWDVEYANPDWEYPDFDNLVIKRDGTWKKSFRLCLEAAELADFKDECHRMHTDPTRTLYHTSILARCGEREFRGSKCPFWRGFFGHQEMEIVFVSNMHFVRTMKLHENIESINAVLTKDLKINIQADQWRCGSTINIMLNPTQSTKKTNE